MKRGYWVWLVWEADYPEDGSAEVVARSHWEAKRKYLGEVWDGDDDADAPSLTARRLRKWTLAEERERKP